MSLETPRRDFLPPHAWNRLPLEPPTALRIGLLGLGGVLALGGVWMLISALLLPQAVALPLDRAGATVAAAQRGRALAAARFGVVRGDLYAQAAYGDAGLLWLERAHGLDAAGAEVQAARSNAETALSLAPVNGSAWLLLATLPPASGKGAEANGLSALEMSYLTAPSDPALALPRVERALASAVPIDKDLQELVKGDLRGILTSEPQQKPAILAAYRMAPPQNQAIFAALAADVDPDFGQSLRGEPPK